MEEDLRVLAEHVVTDIITAVQHGKWSPARYDHHVTGLENLFKRFSQYEEYPGQWNGNLTKARRKK